MCTHMHACTYIHTTIFINKHTSSYWCSWLGEGIGDNGSWIVSAISYSDDVAYTIICCPVVEAFLPLPCTASPV